MYRRITVFSLFILGSLAVEARAAMVIEWTEAPLDSFAASDSDLINQGTVSLAGQSNVGGSRYSSYADGSGLNNGLMYPATGKTTTGGTDSYCPGNGSAITFNLDLTGQPAGYTIRHISSLTGYIDRRQSQKFRVDYSVVGDPAFVNLADETQIDFITNLSNTETRVLIYDDSLAPLATGVDQVRVTYYDTGGTLRETVYRELDVFSEAYIVPDQGVFDDTAQIACKANGNLPFTTDSEVAAAVNFYNNWKTPGKLDGDTILGIAFDDVYMGSSGVDGTFALTANQPGVTMTTDFGTPLDREQEAVISGTDGTAATKMMKDMHTFPYNHADTITFDGLLPDCLVHVQLFGGDDNWSGWPDVSANGLLVGRWQAGDANDTTGSYLAFSAMTDADGRLLLEFPIGAGNYAGISGLIVHQSIPEPATVTLLLLAGLSLLVVRRRG